MPPVRELLRGVGVLLVVSLGATAHAEPARRSKKGDGLLDSGSLGGDRKAPITVTADTLEYDYKTNIVVYRGAVQVTQGDVKVKSDTLTVTLVRTAPEGPAKDPPSKDISDPTAPNTQRVRDIIAVGNVRIDHGTRWATGGRAVFDQTERTLVLTEDPMLHDGQNEVAGERVVVYVDEDRSVVEGGRRRVKAVLYPGKEEQTPEKTAEEPAADETETSTAQAAVP